MSTQEGRDDLLIRQFHTDLRLIQKENMLPLDKLRAIKGEIMQMLPEVKSLANDGMAKAEFYLAQAYKKDSADYLSWMKKASSHGVVDAHFALGEYYLEKGDIKEASRAFTRVAGSTDLFLKRELRELMHENPVLAKGMNEPQAQPYTSVFFKKQDINKQVDDSMNDSLENKSSYGL